MPKRLELSAHASKEELEHGYRKAKDPVERSHHQIVWVLSEGRTTKKVCQVTGYSPDWVRQIARRYNELGVEALGDRRHGNPGAKERALLDEATEAESLYKCQAADGGLNVVPSRSIAQRTLTLLLASAIRAWVCFLPSRLLRS